MDADKADAVMAVAERSAAVWSTSTTSFLSPSEVNAIEIAFKDVADVSVAFVGGYAQANRKVAVFNRREEWEEVLEADVRAGGTI